MFGESLEIVGDLLLKHLCADFAKVTPKALTLCEDVRDQLAFGFFNLVVDLAPLF